MLQILSVGIGGFAGSIMRFAVTKLFSSCSDALSIGTLLSNAAAGLLIGIFIGIDRHYITIAPNLRLLLTTGLLGGLSTFSTFSLETVDLLSTGKYLFAGANIFLNLGLSLLCTWGGLSIPKMLSGV